MKLTLKTLKQENHEVEIDSDNITVFEFKKAAEEKHKIDANSMKLVFNGTILKDENTLQSYNLKEGNVIILMISKVKVQNKKEEPQVINNNNTSTNEKKEENTTTTNNNVTNNTTTTIKQPIDLSNQINTLVEMGFPKEYAEAALKAAKGNVTIAIEFLYNGIPDNLPSEDNNVNNNTTTTNTNNETSNTNTELETVKKMASMVKVLCANDPSQLQSIILGIQRTQPELLELIKRHETEFKSIISQPVSEEDIAAFQEFNNLARGGVGGTGGNTSNSGRNDVIKLSKTDYDVVQRLKEFGFSEMEAAQAYFACEKNEEMALNFLF